MKNAYRSLATVSMVSNGLGMMCLLFLLFTTIWSIELILVGYLLFFVLGLVLGWISLTVKKNTLALVAVLISIFFLVICLFVMHQFSGIDFR